jgi:hypothetical protein
MMAIALTRATVKIKKITRDPCVGQRRPLAAAGYYGGTPLNGVGSDSSGREAVDADAQRLARADQGVEKVLA